MKLSIINIFGIALLAIGFTMLLRVDERIFVGVAIVLIGQCLSR